jgi:hypothetical protein
LTVFAPGLRDFDASQVDSWRGLFTAILEGFSLPGVYYALRRSRAGHRLEFGGLLWLTLSLGILLMLPPAVAGPLLRGDELGSNQAGMCLMYVLPLMSLWFMLGAALSGRLRRSHLGPQAPWTERFGLYLGIAWCPLGLWLLLDFYWDAFFR